jgi:hypothetical protein
VQKLVAELGSSDEAEVAKVSALFDKVDVESARIAAACRAGED